MKHLILYTVFLSVISVYAGSNNKIEHCGKVLNPKAKMQCLNELYAVENNRMENVYNEAFDFIKKSDAKMLVRNYWKADLKRAQEHWLKFRKEECEGPAKYELTGISAEKTATMACLIDLARLRADDLKRRYNIEKVPEKPSEMPDPAKIRVPLIYARPVKGPAAARSGPPLGEPCKAAMDVSASQKSKSGNTAAFLIDDNSATSWLVEEGGPGIGSWIEFKVNTPSDVKNGPLTYSFKVENGLTSSDSAWTENSRVKELVAYYNGKAIFKVHMVNSPGVQEFTFKSIPSLQDKELKIGDKLRFVISKVVQGSRYKRTYLSTFVPLCR